MSEFNNEDKRRKRRAGWIMFGSFVGIAGAVTAITLPLVLDKDDNGTKPADTNPGANPGPGTGGTGIGSGTGGAGTASYSYDFTAAGVTNPTQLYEKEGEPGAYTDNKAKADGYKPEISEKHPAFVVGGHRMAASVPGGSAYDASQWYIYKDTNNPGSAATGTATTDSITVSPYGKEKEKNDWVKYNLATTGEAYDEAKWTVHSQKFSPSITGEAVGKKYFLGLPLDDKFNGKSYKDLNAADKEEIIKFVIKAGALKLGLEPGDELYDADRLKKSTGLKIDLNVALDAANGDVATAIKTFAGTSSFYKTLSGYSDGTPTVISTTAEIDSAPFVQNYPDRNAYGIAHSTILGDVTHWAHNVAEYRGIYYESIFNTVLSMISYIDGQARVPSNSNFSALIFGYGMTYYRLNYEYDSKVLTQINKTYKAIFDNTTGGRVLPVHQYTVGSAGGTATPTKWLVGYPRSAPVSVDILNFELPFGTVPPAVPPAFTDPSTMWDPGVAGQAEHIPSFATIAKPSLSTDTIKVYLGSSTTPIVVSAKEDTTP